MNKPNPQFVRDFNLVLTHYEVTPEEAKYEKQRVMANMAEAERCYSVIAAGIRSLNNALHD